MHICYMQYSIYIIIMKLVDIKGNITSNQRLILLLTMLVAIVVIFFGLRSINKKVEGIDYKNTDLIDLIINSQITNDREVYWNLNEIICNFINSYQSKYNKKVNDLNYYYKALDPNYKKFISKKKYLELSNTLITKVIGEDQDVLSTLPEPVITEVRVLNNYDNAYLCKLSTKNEGEDTYIGIVLDKENTKYNIFYIN